MGGCGRLSALLGVGTGKTYGLLLLLMWRLFSAQNRMLSEIP
jgi:hypothetical protein